MPRDKTSLFSLSEIDAELTRKILDEVYDSLKERGYNPTNQIVGYLIVVILVIFLVIEMLEVRFKKLIGLRS